MTVKRFKRNQLEARYLIQLRTLLEIARQMNNYRVILALSQLITRRGGAV